MTFHTWRHGLGLDMAGAARLLRVDLRCVYLWERAVANDDRPCETAKSRKARAPSHQQPVDPCKYPPRKEQTMTTKHTPGPWRVETWSYDNGARKVPTIQNDKDAVAQVLDLWCMDDRASETEANARLIAAAPDLLEMLQAAVARVQLANAEGNPILSAWLPDALAAIAKAQP